MSAALYYSEWAGSGFQGRLIAEVDDLTYDDTTVDITLRWRVEFNNSVTDSSNVFTTGGAWPATSGSININGTNAWNVRVQTITVARSVGTVAISGDLSSIGAIGEDTHLALSATLTVPSGPVRRPRAAYGFAITPDVASAPTAFTLTWNADITSERPVTAWYIDRWDNVTRRWLEPVVSTDATARSWVDTSVLPDREYEYRINALGVGGWSDMNYDPKVRTRPAAPTKVVATKNSNGSVTITWASSSTIATRYRVWHCTNTVPDASALGTTSSKSWTVANPGEAASHTWYVEAMCRPDEDNNSTYLYSAPSAASNAVGGPAAPFAPAINYPIGVAIDAASPLTVTATHRPGDGRPTTAYEVRYRELVAPGQTIPAWTTVGKVTSGTLAHTFAAGTFTVAKSYEWQMRNWATHADPSPWSASGTLLAGTVPTVSLTGPSSTITTDRVTATWSATYGSGATQATWVLVLRDSGNVPLASASGSGAAVSAPVDYRLANNATYTLQLVVADTNGLVSTVATRTFSVSFVSPPSPAIQYAWNPDLGSVSLTLTNTDAEGATCNGNLLYRWDGSAWVLLASTGLNPTYVDQIPMATPTNRYKVRTTTTVAAASEIEVTVPTPNSGDWFWINYGPGWGSRARARYSPKTTSKVTRDATLHYFAGRTKPVSFSSDKFSRQVSVSCVVEEADTLGNRAAWEGVATSGEPLCYRDPLGRRLFCSIDAASFSDETDDTSSLSFSLDEVDHDDE